MWAEGLSGEGIVLASSLGDERPQERIGGEDPMVTVAMDAGWGEDLGQAVQRLQGRETQGGAAGEVGPRQDVEDLVGAVVNEMKAVEGKGRPSTIPDEPLEARPVGGLDADAGVQTEPATVIPGEHVLGLVGFQEPVAAKVSQDPGADRVLEALQELMRMGCGLMEAEEGLGIG